MKLFSKFIVTAATAISLFCGASHAAVIDVSATQDPSPNPAIPPTLSLTFDLTSQLAAQSALASNILSAIFDIYLTDPANGNEQFLITVGSGAFSQFVTKSGNNNVNNGSGTTNVNFALDTATALADLKADGILSLVLSANTGNYAFDKATLTASVDLPPQPPAQVPEPATLAMFGLGLLGLAALRRRKV